MADLTEHVIINKWDNDINSAIVSVGGDTEGASGLPDYASIIREQLIAKNCPSAPVDGKEFILEGDSCIIEADENGCDPYNTEYAVGIKSGLNPGVLYLRLCTAVKNIEPVYVDLTRLMNGSISVEQVVKELLKNDKFVNNIKNEIAQDITVLQKEIANVHNIVTTKVDSKEVQIIIDETLDQIILTEEEINSIIK